MALDKAAFRDSAKKHFVEKARKEIEALIDSWPCTLRSRMSLFNDLIRAGREMSVTEVQVFSDEEIRELVTDLSPLAELEMRAEIRKIVLPKLSEKGFEGDILAGLATEEVR